MRLDAVTAEIRPRSDWEAVDLGLALVRRDFWRCFAVWWLAVIVPTVAAGWWLWESPMLWLLLFWWWKPAGSRLVLFELSRRLFGERPPWRASLREIPRAWTRRFFYRFVWARFSPWLPVTLAVEDLEGLRGKAYQQRCGQVTRRGEGVVMWIYVISDMAACWFGLAFVLLVKMFIPDGQDGAWRMAIESYDPDDPMSLPLLILRTVVVCVMLAMSLTDMFFTGAGFGVYLNNRTWIEGWDVELAFKRLARRLTKSCDVVGGAVGASACLWLPAPAAERDPAQVIREVKADAAFKVHTVIEKVPNPTQYSFSWDWLRLGLGGGMAGNIVHGCGRGAHGRRDPMAAVDKPAGVHDPADWHRKIRACSRGPGGDGPGGFSGDLARGRAGGGLGTVAARPASGCVRSALSGGDFARDGSGARRDPGIRHGRRLYAARRSGWSGRASGLFPRNHRSMDRLGLCGALPGGPGSRSTVPTMAVCGSEGRMKRLLLMAAAALALTACDYTEVEREIGYKGKARINPWLAAERLVGRMGWKVRSVISWTAPQGEEAVWIVPASILSNESFTRRMEQWVGAGGHLILLVEHADEATNDWLDAHSPPVLEPALLSMLERAGIDLKPAEATSGNTTAEEIVFAGRTFKVNAMSKATVAASGRSRGCSPRWRPATDGSRWSLTGACSATAGSVKTITRHCSTP